MVILLTGWLLGSLILTLYRDALPHVTDWIENGN